MESAEITRRRIMVGYRTAREALEERPKLPELYDAQRQIKSQARRFNVLDVGRRAGKTYLGIHLALETSLAGHPVGWFSPSYKYLLEVWQELTRILRPVSERINATERRIELKNGGLVEVWTLENPDAGRSRKYKRVVIDEAAIAPHLKLAWEEGIRPTLTDLVGDAWFLSTPKGLNYFYELFGRGQDSLAYPDWRSWQMPSSVNPFLPASEIEAARHELPELAFKQEYLAEFLSSEGAVFRNVDKCLGALPSSPSEHRHHYIVGGIDWGRVHDFTAISLICCHCEAEVLLDRFNQLGWDVQRQRLLSILEAWNVRHTLVETNSIGAPNLEAMWGIMNSRQILQGFEMTVKSKAPLIQALGLCFERERMQWLPDPTARHELIAFEAEVMPSGYTRYSAPEGGFDDSVVARALAWRLAKHQVPFPLTEVERYEQDLPEHLRSHNRPDPSVDGGFALTWHDYARATAEKKSRENRRHWSNEVCAPDDPWEDRRSPVGQMVDYRK